MNLSLSRKVALVTGSSHGIGKAIAIALANEGASVILVGRNVHALGAVRKEINDATLFGAYARWCEVDVMRPADIKTMFGGEFFGRLDILVNNVGGPLKFGKFENLTDEDWLNDWNFNFMSMVRFTREAIPLLKESGNGRIINISAVPARQPGVFNPHYAASKAAMLNLSKYLANTLAKDNILVNAICPNTLEGGRWDVNVSNRAMSDGISEADAAGKMVAEEFKKMPLQRMGTPEDVANLVLFLASDKAKYITGTVISVDGGTVRTV